MSHIITLVAAGELDPKHIAAVYEYCDGHLLKPVGAPDVLAVGKACDLAFELRASPEQMRILRDMLAPEKVDVFIGPALNRRKKLLLADMESTIITGELLDELAREAGPEVEKKVSDLTARAMRGEIDFMAALQARVAMLRDLAEDSLARIRDAIIYNDGAKTLVATMRHHGAFCAIVSGGFTYFSETVAADAGFDTHHANILNMADGRLAGTVQTPLVDREAKLSLLRQYVKDRGLTPADSIAVGDGANDLLMLQEAGLGVGYRPKPLLLKALDNCVIHTDLTALLYAQGYRGEEIIISG